MRPRLLLGYGTPLAVHQWDDVPAVAVVSGGNKHSSCPKGRSSWERLHTANPRCGRGRNPHSRRSPRVADPAEASGALGNRRYRAAATRRSHPIGGTVSLGLVQPAVGTRPRWTKSIALGSTLLRSWQPMLCPGHARDTRGGGQREQEGQATALSTVRPNIPACAKLRVTATLTVTTPADMGPVRKCVHHPGGSGWRAMAYETRKVANEHRALLSIEVTVRERPLLAHICAIRVQQ